MPAQAAADPETGGRPSSDNLKRKFQARTGRDTPATEATAPPKQHTISQLFSASQQKPSVRDATGVVFPSSSKRSKLQKSDSRGAEVQMFSPASAAMLTTDQMYSFPDRNGESGTNEIVDLTGDSLPNSPRKTGNAYQPRLAVHPSLGPRKLVVKNLRLSSRSNPAQYLDSTWEKLDQALNSVFKQEKFTFTLNELYKTVGNVCKQGNAAELYRRLQDKCKVHIRDDLKKPILHKGSEKDTDVLRAVIAAWARWNQDMVTIQQIFYYMDRAYLLQSKLPSLQEEATTMFRSVVLDDVQFTRVIHGAIEIVAADRARNSPDLDTFEKAISMFIDLRMYTSFFTPQLLENSQAYIVDWVEKTIQDQNVALYVKSANALIASEMNRCDVFNMDNCTRQDLLALLETHLVSKREARLLDNDEVGGMLSNNAVQDLADLYTLLERRNLGKKLCSPFAKWVEDTGTKIVFDDKEQDSMVTKLLTLKKQLDSIWRLSFRRNTEIGHGLRESFDKFMNKTAKTSGTWNTDNSKPGEMIAKYVDLLLRGGSKAVSGQSSSIKSSAMNDDDADDVGVDEDSVVNEQLDQVLDLFRFVHGKAVFEAFYKKDLARRLLMNRSASQDAERSMLQRLRTECGAGFTQNLEQMFRDVELAREEMKSYDELMSGRNEKAPVQLGVNVLSSSAWPSYPDVPVNIPMNIRASIEQFERHYKQRHSGRKLEWKHALAHCQLKATFPSGKKEIVLSSFQAIVLMLFNNVDDDKHVTYDHLKAETGLPEAELKRTLQSLACAKLRPLTKHPKGREINDTDTFTLNLNFDHPKYHIKINQVQLKETRAENKETHERVAVERSFETQAAIVRIMKSRKTIKHNELVAEVINATKTRGVLPVPDIKKNIDRLIDKDYMQREDDGSYSYVA